MTWNHGPTACTLVAIENGINPYGVWDIGDLMAFAADQCPALEVAINCQKQRIIYTE